MESTNSVNEQHYDEIEIDLKGIFLKVKNYWYIVLIGMIVGILIGVIYKIVSPPQYNASAMIYLRGANASVSLQDLQIGSELTKDYEVILKSRPNLEKVIDELGLDYTTKELSRIITINNLTDTRILEVSVVTDKPNLSRDIANKVVEFGMDSVREIESQEPYVVEKAIIDDVDKSISLLVLIVIGAVGGVAVTVLGIVAKFVLSSNIQSVEDVEKVLDIPVLSVIVDDKALFYAKK